MPIQIDNSFSSNYIKTAFIGIVELKEYSTFIVEKFHRIAN